MAALGFFRRRQKLMMILMVVLMVAFLIPTGIQGCGERNPMNQEYGTIAGKQKLTQGQVNQADHEIKVLADGLGLGRPTETAMPLPAQVFTVLLRLNADRGTWPVTWALLVQEGRKMGLQPTNAQVDQLLSELGLEGKNLQHQLTMLNALQMTEQDLRSALADLLVITQSYLLNSQTTSPTLPELRHLFRDVQERMDLALVTIPAEKYIKDVPEPTEAQVQQWFEQYKNLEAGVMENKTPFGFGYRVPDSLEVQYLVVASEPIFRAIDPSDEQMLAEWERSGRRFMTQVPASQPASGPTTSSRPASEPAEPEMVTVTIEKFSEAKPLIRQRLREQETKTRTQQLLGQAREFIKQNSTDPSPYLKAAEALQRPADSLLARKVGVLRGDTLNLSDLIDQIQANTGVKIVYPFGIHGTWTLDGSVKVKVDPKWGGQTLGEVLDQIADAHKYPKLKWAACDLLPEAIFPVDPIQMLPVMGGSTGMISLGQAFQLPVLTMSSISGQSQRDPRSTVFGILYSFFHAAPGQNVLVHEGEDFRDAMIVESVPQGRMIWRLAKAEKAHTPKELTADIRKQVVHDLKLMEAFKKAQQIADSIKTRVAAGGNLEPLAKADGLEFQKTGLITRKTLTYGGAINWRNVPGLGADPALIEQAFTLAPADFNNPAAGGPALLVAPVFREAKVVLMERIAYEPATRQGFEGAGVGQLAALLAQSIQQSELVAWFSGPMVLQRTEYKPKYGPAPVGSQMESDD